MVLPFISSCVPTRPIGDAGASFKINSVFPAADVLREVLRSIFAGRRPVRNQFAVAMKVMVSVRLLLAFSVNGNLTYNVCWILVV